MDLVWWRSRLLGSRCSKFLPVQNEKSSALENMLAFLLPNNMDERRSFRPAHTFVWLNVARGFETLFLFGVKNFFFSYFLSSSNRTFFFHSLLYSECTKITYSDGNNSMMCFFINYNIRPLWNLNSIQFWMHLISRFNISWAIFSLYILLTE